VSLVIDEVECFKYLGLNLDYKLRREEETKTGVANINFAQSKVAATLNSLKRLPRRGNNAASSPLMCLQLWRSCVYTLALENLWYLRTKGQVQKWQSAVSLSMKRTFCHSNNLCRWRWILESHRWNSRKLSSCASCTSGTHTDPHYGACTSIFSQSCN
jgi:hypothetical protein